MSGFRDSVGPHSWRLLLKDEPKKNIKEEVSEKKMKTIEGKNRGYINTVGTELEMMDNPVLYHIMKDNFKFL